MYDKISTICGDIIKKEDILLMKYELQGAVIQDIVEYWTNFPCEGNTLEIYFSNGKRLKIASLLMGSAGNEGSALEYDIIDN